MELCLSISIVSVVTEFNCSCMRQLPLQASAFCMARNKINSKATLKLSS